MIYVCIPAYEEAQTIGVLLWKVRKVMAEFGRDYQVLVLDDGSEDGTTEALERYSHTLPLRVIRVEERIGHGAATERLLREALHLSSYPKRDVAVTLQADFTENPEDLVSLVKTIEGGADLVAGRPELEGEPLPASVRLSRWLAPRVLGRAFRRAPVTDPLSGFRAYRLVVLKKAFRDSEDGIPVLRGDGWAANLEMLARAAPHARRIEEAPVRVDHDRRVRESRFQPLQSLRELVGLRKTTWPSPEENA